jgi:MoxR-like ATPase
MQEHRVTVQGTTYTLEEPFYVFATQNPIELEGTYPLPEAQLDRFMFEIVLDHLSEEEELQVVRETTGIQEPEFSHAVTGPDLVAVSLARTSRPSPNGNSPEFVKKWVAYGASVRAAQYLTLGAKARALTMGRYTPGFEDIRALAHPVLRHRILTNFHAESEGKTTGELIDELLEAVPVPSSGM